MSSTIKALLFAGIVLFHLTATAQRLHLSRERVQELDSLKTEQNRLWQEAIKIREEKYVIRLAKAKNIPEKYKKRLEILDLKRKGEKAKSVFC